MVLVDTTVWIDLFRNKQTAKVSKFVELIDAKEDICINGLIYTEILQGIRDNESLNHSKEILDDLICFEITKEQFYFAAKIYRKCRKNGITIRKPIDCMIASNCIYNSAFILHNDSDFDHINSLFPLQEIK